LARGADILELHVTFHRDMFGPDVAASVTFDELRLLCEMRDAVRTMDLHPVQKDIMAERLADMRRTFGKSLAPVRELPSGTVLAPDMLTSKKPGGGIPPDALEEISGRRLVRNAEPGRILHWSDLAEDGV
jgi:N-acetylneuraminate synthase